MCEIYNNLLKFCSVAAVVAQPNRRTGHIPAGVIDTAIARCRLQDGATTFAIIKPPAGICRHHLNFDMPQLGHVTVDWRTTSSDVFAIAHIP